MKNKKNCNNSNVKESNKLTVFGFTLIELIAVICILGLIIIVAVPKVMNALNISKRRTFELLAKSIAKSVEDLNIDEELDILSDDITCESVSNITSSDFSSCKISFDSSGKALVTIVGKGRYKGLSICNGSRTEAIITDKECGSLGTEENEDKDFIKVPASYVVASSLIGLGIGPDSDTSVFTQFVDDTVTYLNEQGLVNEDNTIYLLSTNNAKIPYMIDSDILNAVREWMFSSDANIITPTYSGYIGLTASSNRYFSLLSTLQNLGFPFWTLLKGCGINDKVMVLAGGSSRLLGFYFDEYGRFDVGLFTNPYGVANAAYMKYYSISDLTLEISLHGQGSWSDNNVFYSEDAAKAWPNYLTSNCYYIDWDSTIANLGDSGSTAQYYFYFYGGAKGSSDSEFRPVNKHSCYHGYDSVSDSGFARLNNFTTMTSFEGSGVIYNASSGLTVGHLKSLDEELETSYEAWSKNSHLIVGDYKDKVFYPIGIGEDLESTIDLTQVEVWAGRSSFQ